MKPLLLLLALSSAHAGTNAYTVPSFLTEEKGSNAISMQVFTNISNVPYVLLAPQWCTNYRNTWVDQYGQMWNPIYYSKCGEPQTNQSYWQRVYP